MNPDELVGGLQDLKRGPEIQLLLIAMGEAAVEPLARFLLGPPDLHPQPLLEALRRFHLVEAGRALARFGEARAVPLLICGAIRRRLGSVLARIGHA